jgi:hypothetical protein
LSDIADVCFEYLRAVIAAFETFITNEGYLLTAA